MWSDKSKGCFHLTRGDVTYEGMRMMNRCPFMDSVREHFLCKMYIIRCSACITFTMNKPLELICDIETARLCET